MALGNFLQICMPYAMRQNDDASWTFLNREYQPLSFGDRSWMRDNEAAAAALPIKHHFVGLSVAKLCAIAWNGDVSRDTVFLYNDGCRPQDSAANMSAYLKRLSILLKLKVRDTVSDSFHRRPAPKMLLPVEVIND